jgi:hypothetical protein
MAASSLSKNPLVYEYLKIFADVIPKLDKTSFEALNYQKRFGILEEEHRKAIDRLAAAEVPLNLLNFEFKLISK